MMASSHLFLSILFINTFLSIFTLCQSTVPPSETFKFVNQGEFGPYIVEYDGNYRALSLFTSPFQLCFYNVTPNAFILALRMATLKSESLFRWVWQANLANPVRENATVTFGRDGNLVLADPDGHVVWQTGTANKGVVGLKLLSNGNLVLHDSRGRFVWQSFDYPTDTLLVGQVLRPSGPTKLISRLSDRDRSNGPYSLVLEPKRLALYYNNLLYYSSVEAFEVGKGSLASVTFAGATDTDQGNATELTLDFTVSNSTSGGSLILARPKYNATLSFLRLGQDGNLKIYTFDDYVFWGAWEMTYAFFSRNERLSECRLPKRCGSFGLCEDNQCVACPSPKGLLGWSSSCLPPKIPTCNGGRNVDYYKVVGVEHFLNQQYSEGKGPMKMVDCRDRCSNDCKCVGFFYREESSKCLTVPVLDTLIKVDNSSHVVFIKISK
ncbi:hypothetical protein AAC387_Pa06g0795 [Persea americana]